MSSPIRPLFSLSANTRDKGIPSKTSYHSLSGGVNEKPNEDFWRTNQKSFLLKIGAVFLLLQLLFLGNLSYLYGSLWGSNGRVSNLDVLWLDLDGGIIGQSVSRAYGSLQGPSFPSLKQSGHAVDKKIQYGMWEWGSR